MSSSKPLAGLRVLIVEDEYLIAYQLAGAMEELGAEVADMAGSLQDAMEAADRPIDGALVDVHLNGEMSFPLIDKLNDSGVPFILMTGYDPSALPAPLISHPRVTKPFEPSQLQKIVRATFVR